LHIGVLSGTDPLLEPIRGHAWDRVARGTGGLVWSAGANDLPTEVDALRATYEEWARPMRLHRFQVKADGIDADDLDVPEVLDEGEGISELRISQLDARWVKAGGELWAEPVRTVLLPDAKETRRWSALVFGSELLGDLSDAEMMTLAMHGGAVSPVTSYLAIEPGVRPSTEGLDWAGGGGMGSGVGLGSIGTIGHGGGRGRTFDPQKWLETELGRGWAACSGTPGTASVTLESTVHEVVDVTSVELDTGKDATLERCLSQAAWDLDLPRQFDHYRWRSWVVDV
jgi:hypothetical protein